MHELGIAQEVHRLCRRHVAGVAGARLSSEKLAVGELSALEPELLRFAWEAVTADGPDAGAALEIRWCPCRQVCDTCGDVAERQPGSWLRRCPRCGGALRLDGGRELDLLQLTYETPDGEGDADDGTHAPGPHRQEAP